ncbi:MAG: HmuY family protein [Phycisphaerae bacterium]|nr:HmuY family protein [Gemmatimonadaceae bacterium]
MHGTTFGLTRSARVGAALVTLAMLGACEDEAALTGPTGGGEAAINEVVTSQAVNASSTDTLVAFSLTKNAIVPKNEDWDILFRRYEIRLNSAATAGAATKNATAYSLDNNKTKSDAEVLAMTVENTLAAFDAVRASAIPSDNQFTTDRLTENKYGYLNLGGTPTVNAANFWKVKTATGSYALVRVAAITLPGSTLSGVAIESRLQNGTTLGSVQTLNVTFSGAASINLSTNSVVAANGCNWDIRINPATFEMTTNSACNAGTYPGGTSPTFANATSASDAPQYPLYVTQLTGTVPNSVTDLSAPFRYNLAGTMRLHPSFNIYLIKVGAKVYKVQLINYYSATGTGGYPTVRAARIQ